MLPSRSTSFGIFTLLPRLAAICSTPSSETFRVSMLASQCSFRFQSLALAFALSRMLPLWVLKWSWWMRAEVLVPEKWVSM